MSYYQTTGYVNIGHTSTNSSFGNKMPIMTLSTLFVETDTVFPQLEHFTNLTYSRPSQWAYTDNITNK